MVRKWATTDEVEFVFGEDYTYRQRELIQKYIDTGERPFSPGCYWCDEQAARLVTGRMDIYLDQVNAGAEKWPWDGDESELDTKN